MAELGGGEAFVLAAVRTPIGRRGGSLAGLHPVDLLAATLNGLFEQSGADPGRVDDHIAGCVSQVGEQAWNVARNAWLSAGLPESTPGVTVDRQCGSSQQALHFAAQSVMSGAMDLVVASGVEHMTRVPMGSPGAGSRPVPPSMWNRFHGRLVPQGISAELVATRFGVTRDEMDDYAFRSHRQAAAATRLGWLREQTIPIKAPTNEGAVVTVEHDEGIRFELDRQRMADLPSAFFDPTYEALFPDELGWSVTVGNSSQISDGAAAVLIGSDHAAKSMGLTPRARVHAVTVRGGDPVEMLTATIPATQVVLRRGRLRLDEIDVVEINEAFASVVLAWQRGMRVDADWADNHVNANGGAIAVGHPLGATGAKLMVSLIHELERREGRFGLQVICEGGGMANAIIVERAP